MIELLDSVDDLINQILENKLDFEKAPWKEISESAKDLILRCMTTNPKERITPTDALMHPWIVFHSKYLIFI